MGGHANGNVAALKAVETLRDWHYGCPRVGESDEDKGLSPGPAELDSAITFANAEIYRKNRGAFSIDGMGTTLVALHLHDRYAVTACVGDSRIYLFRDQLLTQVTQDHSLIEELLRCNIIGEQDLLLNPNKNIITRALGMSETVEVDTQTLEVQRGDLWLLCSDGLTDMVDDEWMAAALNRADLECNLDDLCESLVDQANSRGGIDNITVILARCSEMPGEALSE